MKNNLLIGLIIFITSGCATYAPITFLHLKEVKVNGIKNGKLLVSANAIFNNPNEFKGKLKNADIYVVYNGDTLANIRHIEKLTVGPNTDFEVPLYLEVSIYKLQKGLLSNLASLIRKRSVDLEFKGDIKVGSFGLTQKIPIKYTATIEF